MKTSSSLSLLLAASMLAACEFVGSGLAPSVTGQAAGAATQPAEIVPLDQSKLGEPSGTSAGKRIAQFRSDLDQLQQTAIQQLQRGKKLQADMESGVAGYEIALSALQHAPQQAIASEGSEQSEAAPAQAGAEPTEAGTEAEKARATAAKAEAEAAKAETEAAEADDDDAPEMTAPSTAWGASQASEPEAPDPSVGSWQTAQAQLQTVSGTLDQMNGLSADAAKNVATAAYLLQSIQDTKSVSDATEADHRQLGLLEEATTKTSASLNQLIESLRQEVPRRSSFLGTESARLAQLTPPGASMPTGGTAGPASARPYVVIPFKDPAVDYEQQLYDAVSIALERWPEVKFELVAVAPAPEDAEAARADMEKVRASLQSMGLPAERVSVSDATDTAIQDNEVRLYVR